MHREGKKRLDQERCQNVRGTELVRGGQRSIPEENSSSQRETEQKGQEDQMVGMDLTKGSRYDLYLN